MVSSKKKNLITRTFIKLISLTSLAKLLMGSCGSCRLLWGLILICLENPPMTGWAAMFENVQAKFWAVRSKQNIYCVFLLQVFWVCHCLQVSVFCWSVTTDTHAHYWYTWIFFSLLLANGLVAGKWKDKMGLLHTAKNRLLCPCLGRDLPLPPFALNSYTGKLCSKPTYKRKHWAECRFCKAVLTEAAWKTLNFYHHLEIR